MILSLLALSKARSEINLSDVLQLIFHFKSVLIDIHVD